MGRTSGSSHVPWWLRLAVFVIPGCKTAEKVTYSHPLTDPVVDSCAIADPAVAAFRAGGVLVAPFVVPLDYENTAIKLVLLADRPASMTVKDARVGARELAADLAIAVDQPADRAGCFRGDVTVGTIATTELDALGKGGLVLTLTVAGADGVGSTLTYTLDRHVETYLVTR